MSVGRPLRQLLRETMQWRRVVLSLAHSDHRRYLGGVQLYMCVEQRALANGEISFVNLWPSETADRLDVSADGRPLGSFAVDEIEEAWGALNPEVVALDVHHLRGWTLPIAERILSLGTTPRTRLFLHDYYAVCSNPTLTFGDVRFCGAPPPDSQACRICRHGAGRPQHLALMASLVARLASRDQLELIAPSQVAADLFSRHYPQYRDKVRVVPHQELVVDGEVRPKGMGLPRLAYVGYGTAVKGGAAWTALLKNRTLQRRFHFCHFGLCSLACKADHVDVDFLKDGPDAMRQALMTCRVDFALLWSVWPETFSFTCYEAIAAGTFVLTHADSGNIAAEVRRTGRGRVFSRFDELVRFLGDDVAVTAARASLTGQPTFEPRWVDTLTRELI